MKREIRFFRLIERTRSGLEERGDESFSHSIVLLRTQTNFMSIRIPVHCPLPKSPPLRVLVQNFPPHTFHITSFIVYWMKLVLQVLSLKTFYSNLFTQPWSCTSWYLKSSFPNLHGNSRDP